MAKKLLALIPTKGKTKAELAQEVKDKLSKKGMLKNGKMKVNVKK